MYGEDPATDLLKDKNFQQLVSEMTRRSIPWEEFLGLPQPRDTSPLETWRTLSHLGRLMAISLPIPDLEDNQFWYRRTHEINNAACTISCACQTDSHLDQITSNAQGQHFLVRSQIEETVASARLDGLAINANDTESLLRLNRKPQSATERLLQNTCAAFEVLPDFVDEPFSLELFRCLHDLLLDGVDVQEIGLKSPSRGIGTRIVAWGTDIYEQYAERQMHYLAAYLNGSSADPDDLIILRGELAANAWQFYRPLGLMSSQVGRLSARLFALKNGLPMLALLPLSKAKVDWSLNLIKPPMVTYDQVSLATANQRNAFDLTAVQTLTVQLMLAALSTFRSRVEAWERRDDEMRRLLYEDPLLNQRQRSILSRALRAPSAEFRIRYHQRNHNIHYTTARRDLLELHEKQYLVLEQKGKAFVFHRGPRLDELDRDQIS